MHTRLSSFWKLAAALTMGALAPACTADTDPTAEAGSGEMLFGLTEAEVISLLPLASRAHDLDTWLEIHRRPFDCANYGSLCEHVGVDAAYEINEGAYHLGLDGATRDEINAYVAAATAAATEEMPTDVVDFEGERASDEAFDGDSNQRVKTKIWADVTGVGDGSLQVECTYQVTVAFGAWGGNESANLTATVAGHFHELNLSGDIYEDTGELSTATLFRHRLLTTQVFIEQFQSGDDIHGWGTCDATLGNFSATAVADASED